MPGRFWGRSGGLGVRLEHLDLAVRTTGYQPLVLSPAHALDQVFVRLSLPFLLPACQVPHLHDAVATAASEMFERVGIFCEGVNTVNVARLEVAQEGLRKHALDFCRIEGSGVFSRPFEGVEVRV